MLCPLDTSTSKTDQCGLNQINHTFNFTIQDVYNILKEHQTNNTSNVNRITEITLITTYSLIALFGIISNGIISFVVIRRSQLQTPRNLYIVNLTFSDIALCLICMPFTLLMILKRDWNFGWMVCKLVPVVQGTNIMISIGTITLIALDRYFTIVRRNSITSKKFVYKSIVAVWVCSILTTFPLTLYQSVVPFTFHTVLLYNTCVEKWPSHWLRISYAITMLLVQSVIPALVLAVVHTRIATYLRRHVFSSLINQTRMQKEITRNSRTTMLLSSIAILFAISWLPLNIFSLVTDLLYYPESVDGVNVSEYKSVNVSSQRLYTAFAICHLIAMSTAITNPILYGWMNTNIRNEFLQMVTFKNKTQNGTRHQTRRSILLPTTVATTTGTTLTHKGGMPLAEVIRTNNNTNFSLGRTTSQTKDTYVM